MKISRLAVAERDFFLTGFKDRSSPADLNSHFRWDRPFSAEAHSPAIHGQRVSPVFREANESKAWANWQPSHGREPFRGSPSRGEPAAQLDFALVEQASEPQGRGLFDPGEAVLLLGVPGELRLGDDAAGEGLEKEQTDGHGVCNGT